MTTPTLLDEQQAAALERKYDPEMRFRPLPRGSATLAGALLIALSLFHYFTAGFGLLQEITHRGVHLAFVLGLVFLVFPHRKALLDQTHRSSWAWPGGVPLADWLIAVAVAAAVMYIPYIFDDLMFRVGNPLPPDVVSSSPMAASICFIAAIFPTSNNPPLSVIC